MQGQQYQNNNMGFNFGVVLAIGNKVDRIGVSFKTYFVKDQLQLNNQFRFYFNLKSLGPKKPSFELVTSTGLVYGYGTMEEDSNFFFNSISNHTGHENSLGYAFNLYFNTNKTSQQIGTISFEIDNVYIVAENDLFARPRLDRFRTGAFLLRYQRKDFALGINSTLFTGEMGKTIKDENYPYSGRYKTDKNGTYTNASHGLLSLQAEYVTNYYQHLQGNLGVDAEKVRHSIQNRFIHDMIFLPKTWRKQDNAHVPMLDIEGHQYLFKPNQHVKKTELYINGYLNPAIFY